MQATTTNTVLRSLANTLYRKNNLFLLLLLAPPLLWFGVVYLAEADNQQLHV